MFLAVHEAVELVAANGEVQCVVAANDNVELAYDAVEAEVVAAHDATKAVVSPPLSLRIISLFFRQILWFHKTNLI